MFQPARPLLSRSSEANWRASVYGALNEVETLETSPIGLVTEVGGEHDRPPRARMPAQRRAAALQFRRHLAGEVAEALGEASGSAKDVVISFGHAVPMNSECGTRGEAQDSAR